MSTDSLSGIQVNGSVVGLDVATKTLLKRCKFDPRIVASVNALGSLGKNIADEAPPAYVMAAWFERMESLRQSSKATEKMDRDSHKELTALKKRLDQETDSDIRSAIETDISSTLRDIVRHEIRLSGIRKDIGTTGHDILALHESLKIELPPDTKGGVSWNPDKPSVNLQINVGKRESVSVEAPE